MSDPFVGEIRAFGFSFPPKGWAACQGQLLPISQNTALFALLGTQFGGNGTTNFALPDLRGRLPLRFGQGPGLSSRSMGETGGSESVTLSTATLPAHAHTLSASGTIRARNASGDTQSPVGAVPAAESSGVTATYSNAGAAATMRAGGVTLGGTATMSAVGSVAPTPHDNRHPYLAVNYCIALQGVFPARA